MNLVFIGKNGCCGWSVEGSGSIAVACYVYYRGKKSSSLSRWTSLRRTWEGSRHCWEWPQAHQARRSTQVRCKYRVGQNLGYNFAWPIFAKFRRSGRVLGMQTLCSMPAAHKIKNTLCFVNISYIMGVLLSDKWSTNKLFLPSWLETKKSWISWQPYLTYGT